MSNTKPGSSAVGEGGLRSNDYESKRQSLANWLCNMENEGKDKSDLMNRLGVPERFQRATVTDLLDWPQGELAAALDHNAGVFLTGNVGVGKSYAAAALMSYLLPKSIAPKRTEGYAHPEAIVAARWLGVPMLLCNLRSTFGRDTGPDENSIVHDLTTIKLLVLDDLASERVTDWTAATVRLIVNTRLDKCLRTIVTSNLTLTEIDAYDPRLASRLGALRYVQIKGEDRRQEK